ncbi:hypothetical protein GCM10009087_39400 [Sphingomonas oligophenolica]
MQCLDADRLAVQSAAGFPAKVPQRDRKVVQTSPIRPKSRDVRAAQQESDVQATIDHQVKHALMRDRHRPAPDRRPHFEAMDTPSWNSNQTGCLHLMAFAIDREAAVSRHRENDLQHIGMDMGGDRKASPASHSIRRAAGKCECLLPGYGHDWRRARRCGIGRKACFDHRDEKYHELGGFVNFCHKATILCSAHG